MQIARRPGLFVVHTITGTTAGVPAGVQVDVDRRCTSGRGREAAPNRRARPVEARPDGVQAVAPAGHES